MGEQQQAQHVPVSLPGRDPGPLRRIGWRVAIAFGLICFVALLTYLERGGYVDPEDDSISLLDAFYYSTVSVTTTGYGDIRPVSDEARLATTLLVTPARILFLVILVGTTLEILAERTRMAYRISRWRKKLNDHIIVCGYGTKGRSAVHTLLAKGEDASGIVVIDERHQARAAANASGLAVIDGDASIKAVLEEAGAARARAVVVAVDRDDTAVLVTLTARELSPTVRIGVAVREEENVHLLHQSGANSVITSSGAAGRMLGLATETPEITQVLEDILSVGEGLDIFEQEINEPTPLATVAAHGPILAVIRGDERLRFDDERAAQLVPGDRVVGLRGVPA